LLILLTVTNEAYPTKFPEIADLEKGIFLRNGRGDSLRPRFVWGRAWQTLVMEERYFVRFVFSREGKREFLRDAVNLSLVVSSFGRTITLPLPVELPRLIL
jgi:hypothetical protein